MHSRVQQLPEPRPDYRVFIDAINRKNTGPVPMIELAVAREVVAALLEEPVPQSDDPVADQRKIAQNSVRLMHRLGYDVVKEAALIPFNVPRLEAEDKSLPEPGTRVWQDQHKGSIQSQEDFDSFIWPTEQHFDFNAMHAAAEVLPDGMKMVGFCGGVLEFTTDIIGLERFMYATYDAPDLLAAVFEKVGMTIHQVFEKYCKMESICALWLGDDMGSKNGTLVSPDLLRAHVFPWYSRFVELAHRHNKPFLLHSCGNIHAIVPDLVDKVGIDGKHSFEDTILPVEQFTSEYADRICVLGGVDVNLLSQGPEEAIVKRTREILDHAAPTHAYVCGSGNSIPNYVPPDHYMAMVETVHAFNGRT